MGVPEAILDDLTAYLASKAIGTVSTDLFGGMMPDQPDDCMALFESGGSAPDLAAAVDYPSVQVRVRDKDYVSGRRRIGLAEAAMHGIAEQDIGQNHYLLVAAEQSPACLGRDHTNRWEWVQNYRIMVRR